MFSTIYVRGIVGILVIGGMMCYLQADSITEAVAGIVTIVYIDRALSGSVNE